MKTTKKTRVTTKEIKQFRIDTKQFFLTYSRCNLSLNEVLDQLKQCFFNRIIEDYILSIEEHTIDKDNDKGTHIHAYIKINRSINIRDVKFFDLMGDVLEGPLQEHSIDANLYEVFHPNIQSVKYRDKVIAYILKDVIDRLSNNVLISPNLDNFISENFDILSYERVMIKLARVGDIKGALSILEHHNPSKYLKSVVSYEKSLRGIYCRELGFTIKYNLNQFDIPKELQARLQEYLSVPTPKTLQIIGSPGTGKTFFIQAFCKDHSLHPLIVTHLNGIKNYDTLIHNAIIFDDVNFEDVTREQLIKLLDCESEADIRILHGSVSIPKNVKRFIVTNKPLDAYVGNDLISDDAIARRLYTIEMGTYSFIGVKALLP